MWREPKHRRHVRAAGKKKEGKFRAGGGEGGSLQEDPGEEVAQHVARPGPGRRSLALGSSEPRALRVAGREWGSRRSISRVGGGMQAEACWGEVGEGPEEAEKEEERLRWLFSEEGREGKGRRRRLRCECDRTGGEISIEGGAGAGSCSCPVGLETVSAACRPAAPAQVGSWSWPRGGRGVGD